MGRFVCQEMGDVEGRGSQNVSFMEKTQIGFFPLFVEQPFDDQAFPKTLLSQRLL